MTLKKRKFLIVYLIITLIIFTLFTLWYLFPSTIVLAQKDSKEKEEDNNSEEKRDIKVPVQVVEAKVGEVSSYTTLPTNLEAFRQVKIYPEISGVVVKMNFEEGELVKKGDCLVELDIGNKEILLEKAKLREENEKLNWERSLKMVQMEGELVISEVDQQTKKYAYEMAKREREEAAWLLKQTRILAPFSGRIVERNVELGERVNPSQYICILADFDPLIAKIYLTEKDIPYVTLGQSVNLLGVNVGEPIKGVVNLISPIVDPKTGTIKVTLHIANPSDKLRPGSLAVATLVRETHKNVVTVPKQALIRELQDYYLFVVIGDKVSRRKVNIGFEEGGIVEVTSGLQVGENIVLVGHGALREGAFVEVIDPAYSQTY